MSKEEILTNYVNQYEDAIKEAIVHLQQSVQIHDATKPISHAVSITAAAKLSGSIQYIINEILLKSIEDDNQ